MLLDPWKYIGHKLAGTNRFLFAVMTDHEVGGGFPTPWANSSFKEGVEGLEKGEAIAWRALEMIKPFSAGGNSVLWSIPKKKGMTNFKSKKLYKDALGTYADPGAIKPNVRKIIEREGDLREATIKYLKKLDKAGKENGIDEKKRKSNFSTGRSKAMQGYYYDLFDALEKNEMDDAVEAMIVLSNLGHGWSDMRKKAKKKGFTNEEITKALDELAAEGITREPIEYKDFAVK